MSPSCDLQISACLGTGTDTFVSPSVFVCIKSLYTRDVENVECKMVVMSSDVLYSETGIFDVSKSSKDIKEMTEMSHSRNIGEKMFLFHKNEIDYAFPGEIIGAFVTGSDGRMITFYLMRKRMTPSSPDRCKSDIDCLISIANSDGFVFFEKLYSNHGDMYFICMHFTENDGSPGLRTEADQCSDGVYVDGSPPIPGKVKVTNTHNGFLTSPSDVLVEWEDFLEDAPVFTDDKITPIEFYEVAIGNIVCTMLPVLYWNE